MFADDGLLLANSVGEITTLIRKTIEIAEEMGLKINKEKSNCMVFNTTETNRGYWNCEWCEVSWSENK